MTENGLTATWALLEPDLQQRARIERQVLEWLDARETTLAAEWLGMIRVRPLASLGYAVASVLWLLLATPLGWLAATVAA